MPYHPAVAPLSIHNPSCELARVLNNQQAAEALSNLKNRSAVSQHLIPGADGCIVDQSAPSKYPLVDACVLCSLSSKGPFHPSRIIVCVNREFIQAPDQQGRDHNPLCPRYQPTQSPSES